MIAHITSDYATRCDSKWLSRICCRIIENGHYISCDVTTQEYLLEVVDKEGSSWEKELIRRSKPFDFTREEQKYMTTLSLGDFTDKQCEVLFGEKSLLILENAVYEWSVYKHIIDTYKHDKQHPNLIKKLLLAINNNRLLPYHGGGWTQHQQHIELQEASPYLGLGRYKICALLDSDSVSEKCIPNDRAKLYCFLCGEDSESFGGYELDKIYTLNQPLYVWHMWYKRCIENYFPNEAYEEAKMNTSNITETGVDRDYLKISEKIAGYSKDKLPSLTSKMSRKKYESGLKHFYVNGEDLSELQLFLLKLVRII